MHPLRSLRRVEKASPHLAGTGEDHTEMGLSNSLPEMQETKVPAMDEVIIVGAFQLKHSILCYVFVRGSSSPLIFLVSSRGFQGRKRRME